MGANDRFKACFGAWILYNKAKTALEHHREGYTYFTTTNCKRLRVYTLHNSKKAVTAD